MRPPLHETSDDPRAYRREQHLASVAREVALLLVHATGAYGVRDRSDALFALMQERERLSRLEHFARIVRDARDPDRLFAQPNWQPSARFLALLHERGLSWAEVEARSRDA
jgi:predicted deacetylase